MNKNFIEIIPTILGLGLLLIGVLYAMSWIFMYAWNYLVDYFRLNIPHLNLWASFLIIVLISYFKHSNK